MSGRRRLAVRVAVFLVAWVGWYILLSVPTVLLDAWSGLRLHYRPGPYNLFTLTRVFAAMPALFLAWQLPRWLQL